MDWCREDEVEESLLSAVRQNDVAAVGRILDILPTYFPRVHKKLLAKALLLSCTEGHCQCVSRLLSTGIHKDKAMGYYGDPPLIRASEIGHLEVVRLLLEGGCNPNCKDSATRRALHWAVLKGHHDVVSLLLKHGANPQLKDSAYGFTPLMIAARQGHFKVTNTLLEYCTDLNLIDLQGETALIEAARNNNMDCLRVLIDNGADVNHRDGFGRTPLMVTVLWNRPVPAIMLIQQNCDLEVPGRQVTNTLNLDFNAPDSSSSKYCTPIEMAMIEGNFKMVKILVSAGADAKCLLQVPEVRGHFKDVCPAEHTAAVHWCREAAMQPQLLSTVCRRVVRRTLGTRFTVASVNQLPLPTRLRDYLHLPQLTIH